MKIKCLLLALISSFAMSTYAQFGVGMRDNRFAYIDYTFRHHYELKIEQSVFSEKIGFQYLRAYAGYKGSLDGLTFKGLAYFGATYNGSYHSYGAMLHARYTFAKRLFTDVRLNPHYDSGYDYNTCFSAAAGFIINPQIDIFAGYTTIPQYRRSEKRINGGFDFHVSALRVIPQISIATTGAEKAKSLRVLMGFHYQF